MQIRTFSAPGMTAVLTLIKDELGPDAVILDTREDDGMVIMTAALEREPLTKPLQKTDSSMLADEFQEEESEEEQPRAKRASLRQEPLSQSDADQGQEEPRLSRRRREAAHEKARGQAHATSPQSYGPPGWQQWHEEWTSIKSHLLALMKPALRLDLLSPRQRLALEYLQREGIDDKATLELFQLLQGDPETSILGPLAELIPLRPWGLEHWPQRIQMVAGPFGAGKTSVAIRLALSLRRQAPNCRICLVNADATRGNGRLLLRHYCDLSEMAYKEASTTMELVAAINAAGREGYERILVDLPGLSRGRFLATLMSDAGLGDRVGNDLEDAAVHLALPPHYGDSQLQGLLARYGTPHQSAVVWTKLDEADQYGQIVNVAVASNLPVSALSFGPGLRNSLSPVRENMLWRLLFKRELPLG